MKNFKRIILLAASFMFISFNAKAVCPSTPAQFVTDMGVATEAQVISMSGVNPLTCDLASSMSETWGGGKLLFSDSPESPSSIGMLFKSTGLAATSGTNYNRVFEYTVNQNSSSKKIVVIIKNTSGSSGTFTVQKEGIAGPTTSFAYAGKLGYNRWDTSSAESGVSVAAGAVRGFDATFNGTSVAKGNLYHGIWDYSFDQTHDIYVCIGITEANCATATLLSQDTHQRGTCNYSEKVYDTASGITLDTATGVQSYPIGGNTTNDANVSCVTETSSAFTLAGNFGLLYKMHITYQSTDSKKMGVCINPRAGGWGGAVWACPSSDSSCGTNQLVGGHFLIPPTSGTSSDNTKCSVAGKYDPGASTKTYWQQFMPTGGSSFPVRQVVVPY